MQEAFATRIVAYGMPAKTRTCPPGTVCRHKTRPRRTPEQKFSAAELFNFSFLAIDSFSRLHHDVEILDVKAAAA
jgi:hypothetical protein